MNLEKLIEAVEELNDTEECISIIGNVIDTSLKKDEMIDEFMDAIEKLPDEFFEDEENELIPENVVDVYNDLLLEEEKREEEKMKKVKEKVLIKEDKPKKETVIKKKDETKKEIVKKVEPKKEIPKAEVKKEEPKAEIIKKERPKIELKVKKNEKKHTLKPQPNREKAIKGKNVAPEELRTLDIKPESELEVLIKNIQSKNGNSITGMMDKLLVEGTTIADMFEKISTIAKERGTHRYQKIEEMANHIKVRHKQKGWIIEEEDGKHRLVGIEKRG